MQQPVEVAPEAGGIALKEKLTVIVTTSPVRSNPDTHVISKVFESFLLVPGLAQCRKLLICDGYLVVESSRYKRGQIQESEVRRYEEFRRRLQAMAAAGGGGFENTEVVIKKDREGFGWAVKTGCELARTPYVLVVQHDRVFMREVDLSLVVDSLDECPDMRYVGFKTSKTRHFTNPVREKGKMQAHRLWFWYDSTHVCRTSFYRTLFTQRYCHFIPKTSDLCAELVSTMTLGSKQPHSVIKRLHTCIVKRGMFIEDTFGQLMLTHIQFFHRQRGDEASDHVHDKYGAWLLAREDGANVVGHLNGRDYLTSCQLAEKGYVRGGVLSRAKAERRVAALIGTGEKPHWAMDEDQADEQWGVRFRMLVHGGAEAVAEEEQETCGEDQSAGQLSDKWGEGDGSGPAGPGRQAGEGTRDGQQEPGSDAAGGAEEHTTDEQSRGAASNSSRVLLAADQQSALEPPPDRSITETVRPGPGAMSARDCSATSLT